MNSYIFIDGRIGAAENMPTALAPDAVVVVLDTSQQGFAQIANALQGISDVEAIHLVSHGAPGKLYLGNSVISGDTLAGYSSTLAAIGNALTAQGDILLYGCDVAAGVTGQHFIQQLAAYIQADVAASTNATGAAALNGDWVLEATTGPIEAPAFASPAFQTLLAAPTLTAAGTLDKSFDTDGKLTTALGTSTDVIASLALQADSKIVAGGYSWNGTDYDFALARYNSNGALDTTFDLDGKLTTALGTGDDFISSVALQADGKIVAGGYSWNGTDYDFALLRYNADGTLDTTFDGDGMLTTALGTNDDQISSLALQADGKIVAGGYSFNGANYEFALARYNADGSLDAGFDGDGVLTTALGTNDDRSTSLALQADGRIVAGGYSFNGANYEFALARYNADGSLDTSFDGDGKLTTALGTGSNFLKSLALQTNGKIVAGGYGHNGSDYDFALARYNADGSLDTRFDGDGKLTTALGAGDDGINSLALQADGKIVAAGRSGNGINDDFALLRYEADGTLDTTFDGDGMLDIAGSAYSVQIQADGAIVAGGYGDDANYRFALARVVGGGTAADSGIPDLSVAENAPFSFSFNANTFADPEDGAFTYSVGALPAWLAFDPATRTFSGTPGTNDVGSFNVTVTASDAENLSVDDTFTISVRNDEAPTRLLDRTFDGDGKLTTALGTSDDRGTSLALQADGKILAGGCSHNGTDYDFALVRYNANGTLDTSFDGDGKLTLALGMGDDQITSLALQADGRIVAAGYSWNGTDYDFALVRCNADGTLDTSFDGDGILTLSLGAGDDQITSLALQADGSIVAGGSSWNSTSYDFSLLRFHADGSLDTTFDGDGILTTALGVGSDFLASLALQADGRIVAGGQSWTGTNQVYALARYNADGTLDTTFDGDGMLTTALGAIDDRINSLALQADGKIVAGGYSLDGRQYDFALVRYNADGTLDSSFDGDGKLTTAIGASDDFISSIALQADGRIVAGGYHFNGTSYDFALARYHTDGTLDAGFDGDGKLTLPGGYAADGMSLVNSIQIQSNGDIVVGGYTLRADGTYNFAVTRLTATPAIPDITSPHGRPFSHSAGFTDPEGRPLVCSAELAGGTPLPSWITLQTSSGDLSGLPTQAQVGRYDIVVSASDGGATASSAFTLAITNTTGTNGNDTLYGGPGADTMTGLAGNDVYTVDHAGDSVVEAPDAGIDLVCAWISDTLDANVENLILMGAGNINGTGNNLNNTITGNSGDNVLDGGFGADQLRGGSGNDTFFVDDPSDIVFENAGEGTDTVVSAASYYLYDHIENLTLAAGAGNIFGSANTSNNTLTGNEGGNLLIGWDGNDTILGGAGNDVIYGVNNDDSLFGEAGIDVLVAGEGNDTLDGGADADELYGENGNDVLYGGSGFVTDILVGGAGNDTLDGSASVASGQPRNAGDFDYLYGQLGDDTYYVDTVSDLTFEFNGTGEGIDTVIADITGAGYYLYDSTENLILTGNTAFGVGNGQNNVITGSVLGTFLLGGAGDDTINGKQGNDVLFGEAGADTFVFERGTNGDVIGDFTPGVDKIQLIGIGYNSFAQVQGALSEVSGTAALDLGLGDFVVINGLAIASLSAGDFLFA